ncbi:hypothetical protein LOK49_LG08G02228 [Camellia lanceoleosa]|uniref:Uncharacterized protein n=1 Tax=Camellia lanceoleosa TaxID=1840588 RepID=A0ACC0GRN1_9ERIC|nr:hypothetical protein LOK49_LG08G02228 [Camellia lanceoleosa]
MDHQPHILLVTFPGQGHINPSLQFSKRLIKMGVKVTLLTAFSALNRMTKTIPTPQGLTILGFSDGYDDGFKPGRLHFFSELTKLGSQAVTNLITESSNSGRPFTRLDPSNTAFGGDLFKTSRNCIEWLDSKEDSSVVYVSFGSVCELSNNQIEEIARGLLKSHRPFLWVIRATTTNSGNEEEDKLSCEEELEKQGMIVPWCSQVEVLSHSSLGCFVTHCGWNSTLEGLVSGVPMVAFPQWSDQATNAKLIKDVWKTGVRVIVNEEGVVEGEEIERCIEMVMESEEMRRNAKKWRVMAREVVKEGGSSDLNLKAFLSEIGI